MVNFGDVGRICVNQEIQGLCKNCLWCEWDAAKQQCANAHYHICPLYRERLFNMGSQAGSNLEARRSPAGGGSTDPPAVKAGGSGIS